jgi:hypothetical protein
MLQLFRMVRARRGFSKVVDGGDLKLRWYCPRGCPVIIRNPQALRWPADFPMPDEDPLVLMRSFYVDSVLTITGFTDEAAVVMLRDEPAPADEGEGVREMAADDVVAPTST